MSFKRTFDVWCPYNERGSKLVVGIQEVLDAVLTFDDRRFETLVEYLRYGHACLEIKAADILAEYPYWHGRDRPDANYDDGFCFFHDWSNESDERTDCTMECSCQEPKEYLMMRADEELLFSLLEGCGLLDCF